MDNEKCMAKTVSQATDGAASPSFPSPTTIAALEQQMSHARDRVDFEEARIGVLLESLVGSYAAKSKAQSDLNELNRDLARLRHLPS